MEKTYFVAYFEDFELRTKHGKSWTKDEICEAFLARYVSEPTVVGKFDTYEAAKAALLDEFGNPRHAITREYHASSGWLLTGQLSYVAEEVWEVDEDGDEDFAQDNGWFDIFIEPFVGGNDVDD